MPTSSNVLGSGCLLRHKPFHKTNNLSFKIKRLFLMHFCPGTMITHTENWRNVYDTQHWTQNRTSRNRNRATQMLTWKFVKICLTPLTTAPLWPIKRLSIGSSSCVRSFVWWRCSFWTGLVFQQIITSQMRVCIDLVCLIVFQTYASQHDQWMLFFILTFIERRPSKSLSTFNANLINHCACLILSN